MLDIKLLRETPDVVRADLRKRGRDPAVVEQVLARDAVWRDGLKRMEELRAERNRSGKLVAEAKKAGQDAKPVLERMSQVAAELKALETAVPLAEKERDMLLRTIPNLMHPSVPVGKDDTQKKWAELGGYTCNNAVLSSPEFLENTPYNKAFAESMGFVKDFWAVPVYGEMMQTGQAELNKFIVEGEGTAQGTLDNIAKTHEDILKKGGLLK